MAGPITAVNKLALASAVFVIICLLIFSTTTGLRETSTKVVEQLKESAKETTNNLCNNDRPVFGKPSLSDSFFRLYEPIRYPVDEPTYTDASGKVHEVKEDAPWWREPLRNQVLIVDIDTRIPDKENELWNEHRLNWETMKAEGDGGMVSASFMNHFFYAQIHGYDYRFINAADMEGMHNTWVKPHVLYSLLKSYKFVIFIDADATIQHLELPVEWLFNRWGITPDTSIAMPLDTRQILNGDEHASEDSRGKLALNTGVVIAQALPHTFDMLEAWKECPTSDRYPECKQWANEWSHEQKAFSEYIRYDFNPNGTNIVEIPCNDAMGYPGITDHSWITSKCTGQFIRHHTIDKHRTKKSTEAAMMQSLTDLLHQELHGKRDTYLVKEKVVTDTKGNEPELIGLSG
ncbi:hypothetical protein ACJQWK_08335 [Exserohilum turcicum]|uniref:Galactosyl transferase n=1 Tax=Exserohilum turcicum (strain 28A) TaxID=671987 RepID=R0ISS0_EXST2|nr:uncharacterized protein SETTUDRAFT_168706 [Exserohilum turcica Et28A]EOA87895.1 hypothetical protein SETTUDRAFT_168706 [Exserohilum turcica Et28A]